MKFIAVIPAFNERQNIREVVQKTSLLVDRVIVVDDGSIDDTSAQLNGLSSNIFVLRHKINLGKGAALKTGCEAALKMGVDVIIMLDSDGQHNPEKILEFKEVFKKNENINIVFGARSIGRDMPLAMMIGNKILSLTTSILFKIYISDTQSGFRAFRTKIYPLLKWNSHDYSVETEIIVNTGKHKIPYKEIDIETIYTNIHKGTTFIDGIRIFINMIIWRLI